MWNPSQWQAKPHEFLADFSTCACTCFSSCHVPSSQPYSESYNEQNITQPPADFTLTTAPVPPLFSASPLSIPSMAEVPTPPQFWGPPSFISAVESETRKKETPSPINSCVTDSFKSFINPIIDDEVRKCISHCGMKNEDKDIRLSSSKLSKSKKRSSSSDRPCVKSKRRCHSCIHSKSSRDSSVSSSSMKVHHQGSVVRKKKQQEEEEEEGALERLWQAHLREIKNYQLNREAHPQYLKLRKEWDNRLRDKEFNINDKCVQLGWESLWNGILQKLTNDEWRKKRCQFYATRNSGHSSERERAWKEEIKTPSSHTSSLNSSTSFEDLSEEMPESPKKSDRASSRKKRKSLTCRLLEIENSKKSREECGSPSGERSKRLTSNRKDSSDLYRSRKDEISVSSNRHKSRKLSKARKKSLYNEEKLRKLAKKERKSLSEQDACRKSTNKDRKLKDHQKHFSSKEKSKKFMKNERKSSSNKNERVQSKDTRKSKSLSSKFRKSPIIKRKASDRDRSREKERKCTNHDRDRSRETEKKCTNHDRKNADKSSVAEKKLSKKEESKEPPIKSKELKESSKIYYSSSSDKDKSRKLVPVDNPLTDRSKQSPTKDITSIFNFAQNTSSEPSKLDHRNSSSTTNSSPLSTAKKNWRSPPVCEKSLTESEKKNNDLEVKKLKELFQCSINSVGASQSFSEGNEASEEATSFKIGFPAQMTASEAEKDTEKELENHSPHLDLLCILKQIGDKLGVLAAPIQLLYDVISQAHKEGKVIIECLDNDATALLLLIKNKLKRFLACQDISIIQKAIYQETLGSLRDLLKEVEECKAQATKKEVEKVDMENINMKGLAQATKEKDCKDTVQFIRQTLTCQHIEVKSNELMNIYLTVRKIQASMLPIEKHYQPQENDCYHKKSQSQQGEQLNQQRECQRNAHKYQHQHQIGKADTCHPKTGEVNLIHKTPFPGSKEESTTARLPQPTPPLSCEIECDLTGSSLQEPLPVEEDKEDVLASIKSSIEIRRTETNPNHDCQPLFPLPNTDASFDMQEALTAAGSPVPKKDKYKITFSQKISRINKFMNIFGEE